MKEKEMSLNLCVTCGFDYTYSFTAVQRKYLRHDLN